MDNKIEVTLKYKKGNEAKEEFYSLSEKDPKKSIAKIVAFAYQQYVRKDIEIESIDVLQWVPARYKIGLADDGRIIVNGKKYSLVEDLFEMAEKNSSAIDFSEEVKYNCCNDAPVEKCPAVSPKVSEQKVVEKKNPVGKSYIQMIIGKEREKIPVKVAAIGETCYVPTEEEKDNGIFKVIILSKPKKVMFDPLFDNEKWPIKKGDIFGVQVIYEKSIANSIQKVYLIYDQSREIKMEIPVEMFNDVMEGNRDTSFIQKEGGQVIGSAKGNEDFSQSKSASGGQEIVSDYIPLQRG